MNQSGTVIAIFIVKDAMMSIFSQIIGAAWFCEKLGINIRFHFNNNCNLFENSELVFSKKYQNKSSVISRMYFYGVHENYAKSEISSEYGQRIITKMGIKQELQQQAKQWINDNLPGNWISVHYRGTDVLHVGCVYRRMKIETYIAYLKRALSDDCNIFACSDQVQFIDQVHAAFPRRVFSRDITRSSSEICLHWPSSKYSGFQQKEEAMIDLLIVSKSSLVYTTGSYFIEAARFLNPSIKIISLDGREVCYKNFPNYISDPQKIRS